MELNRTKALYNDKRKIGKHNFSHYQWQIKISLSGIETGINNPDFAASHRSTQF